MEKVLPRLTWLLLFPMAPMVALVNVFFVCAPNWFVFKFKLLFAMFCKAPRSGLAWKKFIDVGAGVIDADYRGNVGKKKQFFFFLKKR